MYSAPAAVPLGFALREQPNQVLQVRSATEHVDPFTVTAYFKYFTSLARIARLGTERQLPGFDSVVDAVFIPRMKVRSAR